MQKLNSTILKVFIGLLLFFWNVNIYAQEYTLIAKIDTVAKIATVDNLGNLFVVTPQNELLKFNPNGKFLWNYTNKSYGEITQLDVTDPLRVVLYYPAYQQVVVLNNNLGEISKYTFNQNPNLQISLMASANNNGFWAYDEINRELRKLTNYFVDDLKSGNIYQRNGFDMQANFMLTDDQQVYINDTTAGIRIFDKYGNFVKTAVIYPKADFDVDDNDIYFTQNNELLSYNYQTFDLKQIPLPDSLAFKKATLRFNRLIILREKDLTLWSVKKN
ncbi:hypothetical protein [Pedobacter arcticus]|uniref:hypothetical protein n=1 Tax=Pedobacter arcticus TaxID=752140 RepID=UPI0002F66C79|nr:hypothetical protein [Pedobacter arcticus]